VECNGGAAARNATRGVALPSAMVFDRANGNAAAPAAGKTSRGNMDENAKGAGHAAPVIELRDIHKSYGALEVIKGIGLTARKGDVIALIGSSGSGKSTLLRCINLLEIPQQGEILFQGEPVRWKSRGSGRMPADADQVRRIRTNLSMVFQQFNLWAHLTVLENVIEAPVTVLRRDPAEAREFGRSLLEKVGIGDKCDNYPSQLSGGQQQRAAIARALAMEPAAMLFDEPTSALDPELQGEVVRVIKSLAEEGRTMLIVTHDMKMAGDVANHVIFLHQGRIEEEGSPGDVFGNTRSERLRQFLSVAHA
jgi:polar amino acid transport system ATP-binding protein